MNAPAKMITNDQPPVKIDFRAIGFTDVAINFPLSDQGCEIIAIHNGVSVEKLSPAFRYAPNAYMQKWIEALGLAKHRGLPFRNDDRQWVLLSELIARGVVSE